MEVPTFEWDPEKAAANLKAHKVSFEEAVTVFQDPLAVVFADPDHSEDEQREILVGHSANGLFFWCPSPTEGVEFALSALVELPAGSVESMKKASGKKRDSPDELRAEYDFDFSKARPNPYAGRLKGRAVAVVLDPDVAEAFPTSES